MYCCSLAQLAGILKWIKKKKVSLNKATISQVYSVFDRSIDEQKSLEQNFYDWNVKQREAQLADLTSWKVAESFAVASNYKGKD